MKVAAALFLLVLGGGGGGEGGTARKGLGLGKSSTLPEKKQLLKFSKVNKEDQLSINTIIKKGNLTLSPQM